MIKLKNIRAEKAEAELAQAKKDYDWMMAQHDMWKACAFKEAELKDGFKAELDAARPLLEAIEGAGTEAIQAEIDYQEIDDAPEEVVNILRAALACREEKK